MLLRSPKDLHYPITVTELLKQPNDDVERFAPLFSYFYTSTVTEGNRYGEEFQVEKSFPTRFESETDGKLQEWKIHAGTVIAKSGVPLVTIEELCRHEIQFGGMCANCGKDMTQVAYNTSTLDSNRAPINIVHGNTALTISQSEAAKAEQEAKRRLLATRRLSLVVDLDQTVIHATVDPTVAEWQKDEDNPNHAAVKHVRSFQLIDDGPGARGCWYYIKLRPGLEEFLQNISKLYELHIYTMGTRAYAQNIVKIIDPDSRLFGDRVLSRDESGSLVSKTLHRLFPVDTKMVVIIDDRGDVWSWSDNLIKVPAYDFFIGIGDINSSFLPKRTELGGDDTNEVTPPQPADEVKANEVDDGLPAEKEEKESTEVKAPETTAEPVVNPATEPLTDADVSTLEKQLVAMSGGDDRGVLQQQNQDQEEVIAAQVSDRPLAQKQLLLQKADAEAGQDGKGTEAEQPKHRNLLHDDDSALEGTEACLRRVHQAFFKQYESRLQERSKGEEAKPSLLEDASLVPDVKEIMPAMKHEVLANVSIVFTGMVPLGVNIHHSDIALWAKTFGANVTDKVTRRTTHVVATKTRITAKVRQAMSRPGVKIISIDWLYRCFITWEQVSESPFLIHQEGGDKTPVDGANGVVAALDDVGREAKPLATVNGVAAILLNDAGAQRDQLDEATDGDEEDSDDGDVDVDVDVDDNDDVEGDDDELDALMPTTPVDPSKPLGGTDQDWKAMNDEMEEWLAESGSDEGSQSDDGDTSSRSDGSNRKRKRPNGNTESDITEDEELDHDATSTTRKRPRTADEPAKKRSSVANAVDSSMKDGYKNAEPKVGVTGLANGSHSLGENDTSDDREDAQGDINARNSKAVDQSHDGPSDDDFDEDAAAALEAEMEAEFAREGDLDNG